MTTFVFTVFCHSERSPRSEESIRFRIMTHSVLIFMDAPIFLILWCSTFQYSFNPTQML